MLLPLGEGPLLRPSRKDGEGPLIRPRPKRWSHQGGQQSRGASNVCCPPWVRDVGLVVTPRGTAEPGGVECLLSPLGEGPLLIPKRETS